LLLRRGRKLTSCLQSGLIVTQQSGRWASRCRYPVPSTVWLVSWRVVGVSHLAWLDDGRLDGWPIRESVDGGRRSLNSVREGSGEEIPPYLPIITSVDLTKTVTWSPSCRLSRSRELSVTAATTDPASTSVLEQSCPSRDGLASAPEGDGRLPMSQAVAEWFVVTLGSRGGDGSGRKIRSGRGPSSPWLELNPAPRR
jgi:hypothetical protein